MTSAPSFAALVPSAPVDGTPLHVVVVNGSPSRRSKTMGLVDVILQTLAEMLPVEASRVDVYRLGPEFTGAVERGDVTPEVEEALRPLFGFFQAMTVPVAIFASSGDFDGTLLLNPQVHGRIQIALTDVAGLLKARAGGTRAPDA